MDLRQDTDNNSILLQLPYGPVHAYNYDDRFTR